jgi:hypothetical protein
VLLATEGYWQRGGWRSRISVRELKVGSMLAEQDRSDFIFWTVSSCHHGWGIDIRRKDQPLWTEK